MTETEVRIEQDDRYGEPDAPATSWPDAVQMLTGAELYWITTVRDGGHLHTTPLIGVWLDDAMHFVTGPAEQKYKNLERDPHCSFTTGTNALHAGLDVVVEGVVQRIADDDRLRVLADAFVAKYGEGWRFQVSDGYFQHGPGHGVVFRVVPSSAHAFGKDPYSQTAYRFG